MGKEVGSRSGVLHLCNSGSCSWQEYGQEALNVAIEMGLELKTSVVEPLMLADMTQFVVGRPVHTSMDTGRYLEFGFSGIRSWKEALAEYLAREIRAGKFSISSR